MQPAILFFTLLVTMVKRLKCGRDKVKSNKGISLPKDLEDRQVLDFPSSCSVFAL